MNNYKKEENFIELCAMIVTDIEMSNVSLFILIFVACIIISFMIIVKSYLTMEMTYFILQDFSRRLLEMLVGIYSKERTIIEVISSFHIDKTHEGRKNKQRAMEVEDATKNREEQQRQNKSHHSRKDKRVAFEDMETPYEYFVEINANEVTSIPQKNTKQHKHKIGMVNDDFIPSDYEEIFELDETHLNCKKRKAKVVDEEEFIVTYEYHDGSPKGSREIITPGVDLEDGIIKTTQNTIRDRLRRKILADEGHTFLLNVKQLYKPIEGKEKHQIRKPHWLHIQNLKELIRHNPYAHVVDYLVLVDLMEVPTKYAFDRSKCFEYKYYVIGGNNSAEARRELMEEYPNNPLFETIRGVIYVGSMDGETKLLAQDHNTDNEYRMSMTFIQRVRFIHNNISVIYGGDRSNIDAKFMK
jgi:hypothetical protein